MRTSGKVLKDFESLRKALFNEEISHIAFMRDGKPEILYTQKYVDKLEQEIERLNNIINEKNEEIEDYSNKWCELAKAKTKSDNIINELEKWVVESIEKYTEDYLDWKYDRNVYLAGSKKLQNVLNKIQELKGSNDNG